MINRLLVIIPALNEEEQIGQVIRRIPKKINLVKKIAILVVDDGSRDKTASIAKSLKVEVIKHPFNLGVGVAFDSGLQYALENNYDLMVFIDGDGQFDPRDIPKVVKPVINKEADFVTASRFINKNYYPQMPPVKYWGNRLIASLISRMIGRKYYDVSCGFRAYSRQAMIALNLQGEFTYTHEVFLDLAFRRMKLLEVPVKVKYFPGRRSRVAANVFSYAAKTSNIIFRVYRDYRPLSFFWGIGCFFVVIAFAFESILLWTFATTGSFTPNIWSGFIGAAFLFLAIMFFIVGILADMNTRIRRNQEKILTFLKKELYSRKRKNSELRG